jgi:acyl-CoA dehydrogenase
MARILRDAQVLSVWEGPANIQALEVIRLLASYGARSPWESRMRTILGHLSDTDLHELLSRRFDDDLRTVTFTLSTAPNRERYAKKLLHRLSQSLAFGMMCEAASQHHASGDVRATLSAIRYYEEIEPTPPGAENLQAREAALQLLDD